jgi:hypothetical protein
VCYVPVEAFVGVAVIVVSGLLWQACGVVVARKMCQYAPCTILAPFTKHGFLAAPTVVWPLGSK